MAEVKDANGKSLGKVRVGDTKLEALQRLNLEGRSLFDKDDFGLLDSDKITANGGPYVVKDYYYTIMGSPLSAARGFTVGFTVLRDNRQADGLRRLYTAAARKHLAFYTESGKSKSIQTLHDGAFKSEAVPDDFDLSGWSAGNEGRHCARFLSVKLFFLSLEAATAFQGDVIDLLSLRPSAALVDKNTNSLVDPDNGIVIAEAADPIAVPTPVFEHHCAVRGETTVEEPYDSKDYLDLTETETVTLPAGCVGSFNECDRLWPAHAIEKRKAFTLFAEKAHIFPHRECVKTHSRGGKKIKIPTGYEWLDDPMEAEFNFLYLSPTMHLAYDGTRRGRGSTRATKPSICIEPLARTHTSSAGVKYFKLDRTETETRATIPLRVWCVSEDVANNIKDQFVEGSECKFHADFGLHYFENINVLSVQCVHRQIEMGAETLVVGGTGERVVVYRDRRVPYMNERLENAWSLTKEGTLSSTEIMEKCLLYATNHTWNKDWDGVVAKRTFASAEG